MASTETGVLDAKGQVAGTETIPPPPREEALDRVSDKKMAAQGMSCTVRTAAGILPIQSDGIPTHISLHQAVVPEMQEAPPSSQDPILMDDGTCPCRTSKWELLSLLRMHFLQQFFIIHQGPAANMQLLCRVMLLEHKMQMEEINRQFLAEWKEIQNCAATSMQPAKKGEKKKPTKAGAGASMVSKEMRETYNLDEKLPAKGA